MILGRLIRYFGVRHGVKEATKILRERMEKDPKFKEELMKKLMEKKAEEQKEGN